MEGEKVKNVVIVFIIILILMYYCTGRYQIVVNNFQERGIHALKDEPVWIAKTIQEKSDAFVAHINNLMDGRSEKKKHRFNRIIDKAEGNIASS